MITNLGELSITYATQCPIDVSSCNEWPSSRYFGGLGFGSDPFLDEREIYPEWFEADSADQCDDVPDNVNTGRIRDVCGDVSRKYVPDPHQFRSSSFLGRPRH